MPQAPCQIRIEFGHLNPQPLQLKSLKKIAETALNIPMRRTSSRMCSARFTFRSTFVPTEDVHMWDTYATIGHGKIVRSRYFLEGNSGEMVDLSSQSTM